MTDSVKPLDLPKLDPALVAARNRLFTGTTRAEFKLGKATASVELTPGWNGGDATMLARGLWGEAEFEWLLSGGAAEAASKLAGLSLDRETWAALPETLRLALAETALDDAFKRLAAASGEATTLAALEEFPARPIGDPDRWIFLDWRLADGPALHSAFRFTGDAENLKRVSALFSGNARRDAPVPRDWPVEGTVELLTEKVDLQLLKAAPPGSIIVLAGGGALADGRAALRLGRRHLYPVRLKDGIATILENDMPEEKKTPAEAAKKGKNIDAIEVNLTLELDSRMWQAGELAQIQPGYVFDTGKTLASPVTLKVNGREWGRGEMVDLNGKVGVRLVSVT